MTAPRRRASTGTDALLVTATARADIATAELASAHAAIKALVAILKRTGYMSPAHQQVLRDAEALTAS